MANTFYQYGLSTVNFGTPILSGFGIISKDASVDQSPNINAIVENETGSIVVRRLDDTITTFNFSGYTNNGTGSFSLAPGVLASITSSIFTGQAICETVGIKYACKEFTQFSAKLVNNPNIDYSVVIT